MNRQAREFGEDIGQGLEELIDSAQALLEELQDQQGPAVESLRARAAATLKSASRHLSRLRPGAEELASRTFRSTLGFIRRDPWRAIALGALAVVAIGILAHSGDSDED
jgi:ElaB/YqjD/DUF883 family membrane-anchored ribosome-binding protein